MKLEKAIYNNSRCKKCGGINTTYKIIGNRVVIICRRCNSIINEVNII